MICKPYSEIIVEFGTMGQNCKNYIVYICRIVFRQYFTKTATVASCKRTSSNAARGDFSDDVRAYSYEHKYRSNTSVV